jgi:hypothetical protein
VVRTRTALQRATFGLVRYLRRLSRRARGRKVLRAGLEVPDSGTPRRSMEVDCAGNREGADVEEHPMEAARRALIAAAVAEGEPWRSTILRFARALPPRQPALELPRAEDVRLVG